MSSSFIQFQGHGFWSYDPFTETLIAEVAANAEHRTDADWIKRLSAHWKLQSSGAYRGWMHLMLDEFITSSVRNTDLQTIVSESLQHRSDDDPIRKTGVLLLLLLKGDITWMASSPTDYVARLNEP